MDQAQIDRLTRALTRLSGRAEAFSGYCFRCVKPYYSSSLDAFSGAGSQKVSGRFHVKGKFIIVYTSTNLQTAGWEYLNTAVSIGLDTAYLLPYTAVSAEANFSRVLNLTDSRVRKALKVTLAELRTSVWNGTSQETLTQLIGRLAYEAGFEAILAPSAGRGQNLNILRQNLQATSYVKIVNEDQLPRS
jgi:RES domain-containing protein